MTNDSTPGSDRTSLLFVCMGNICRSPLAEGIFAHLASQQGIAGRFDIDSAGTGGWHAGELPDPRARDVACRRGVRLLSRARQVDPKDDFERFEYFLVMDRVNRQSLEEMGAPMARVHLIRSFDPTLADARTRDHEVPDPYYGGPGGFDEVFDMLLRACGGLLDTLRARPR